MLVLSRQSDLNRSHNIRIYTHQKLQIHTHHILFPSRKFDQMLLLQGWIGSCPGVSAAHSAGRAQ